MATSPTPSLDSIRGGTNSIESYGEHNGYLSDSPLTLSGSSPPVSDSAIICDEFRSSTVGSNTNINQHHPISASVSSSSSASSSSSSSASSTSSSSGLSGCGSTSSANSNENNNNTINNNSNANNNIEQQQQHPGVIGSNLNKETSTSTSTSSSSSSASSIIANNTTTTTTTIATNNLGNLGLLAAATTTSTSNINIQQQQQQQLINSVVSSGGSGAPRCTACKSKQSDAVAKCFECVSYLCDNCVQAHKFMLCFSGHTVCHFNKINSSNNISSSSAFGFATQFNNNTNSTNLDYKFNSSLSMMLQKQQQQQQSSQQQQSQQQLTQLSKIVLNSSNSSNTTTTPNSTTTTTTIENHEDDIFNNLLQQTTNNLRLNNTPPINTTTTTQQQQQQSPLSPLYCHRHKHELLKYSCRTCCTIICKECISLEHNNNNNNGHGGVHEVEIIQEHALISSNENFSNAANSAAVLQSVQSDLRNKVADIMSMATNADNNLPKLKLQYQKAHNEINETHQFFCSMLDERKHELIKELDTLYNSKLQAHNNWQLNAKQLIDKSLQTCDSIELLTPQKSNVADVLVLRKNLDLQLHATIQDQQLPYDLEFVSNYQSIQVGVRNTFGYIRANNANNLLFEFGGQNMVQKQPPIARPLQSNSSNSSVSSSSSISGSNGGQLPGVLGFSASLLDGATSHNFGGGGGRGNLNAFDDLLLPKRYTQQQNNNNSNNGTTTTTSTSTFVANPYEKWSNGGNDNFFATDPFIVNTSTAQQLLNSLTNAHNLTNGGNVINTTDLDLNTKLLNLGGNNTTTTIYPPKSQIKRHKMIYHCKFGEFGVMEGQFTEPSGVAVNAQNDIIVADTNNHRIQIFDKEGRFKFQFGECGKRDSQLLYPNRVAVVRNSGDIIVTERSPTHQIQIYNQYGQFVRKFGANILQHPRGVTVDNKGRIIVVECKVMRVIIFDQNGTVLHKFGCSKHLEFPNGVVVNDKQEIFISDNRAHCVKVFNYEGQYLRQIGGEGVTNYPIGVGINANGDILIADNHNNFNLTIFKQDGTPVSALESKVKHAQCFDVALMDDGSVVLASKDYRLYIYRYVQVPPLGL